jgi:hypothetical protein
MKQEKTDRDIAEYRCCMCPNGTTTPTSKICPPGGPSHKPKSPCRFVTAFFDENGSKVFVSNGIDTTGKAWFSVRQKDSRYGTHRVKTKNLPIRKTFDEAQHDLNVYAREKGWKRV